MVWGPEAPLGRKVPRSVLTQQRPAAPKALLEEQRFLVPTPSALQASSTAWEEAQAFCLQAAFGRRKGGALECADLCLLQGPGAETHSFQHRSSAEARGGCGPMLGRTTQEHPLPLGWFPEGLWLPWSLRPPPQHPSLMRRGRPLRPGLAQVHSQGSAGSVLPGQGCAGTLEAGGPAAPFRKLHNWFWKPLQLHRSRAHMACVLREVAWWLEGVGAARKAAGQGLGL